MALVELAFRRIVDETPGALAERIIAMVLTGDRGGLGLEVEELLRRELGGILGDCRDSVARGLEDASAIAHRVR